MRTSKGSTGSKYPSTSIVAVTVPFFTTVTSAAGPVEGAVAGASPARKRASGIINVIAHTPTKANGSTGRAKMYLAFALEARSRGQAYHPILKKRAACKIGFHN